MKHDTSLVLRVCNADFTSYNGFQWPSEIGADTTAPDWKANNKCGNGLHGWLHGYGDVGATDYWSNRDAKWLVLEVPSSEIIDLGGKVKFPSATVRFIGSKSDAAEFILKNDQQAVADTIIGLSLSVGDNRSVSVGDLGTAIAGDLGTAIAGKYGTASAGDLGSATAGDGGSAIAGNHGSASAGEYGTATAGYNGSATAGEHGTAIAGKHGSATAGRYGSASAGEYGVLMIKYWDSCRDRYAVAYVGENGILPNVKYKLDDNHNFVVAE